MTDADFLSFDDIKITPTVDEPKNLGSDQPGVQIPVSPVGGETPQIIVDMTPTADTLSVRMDEITVSGNVQTAEVVMFLASIHCHIKVLRCVINHLMAVMLKDQLLSITQYVRSSLPGHVSNNEYLFYIHSNITFCISERSIEVIVHFVLMT